MVIILARGKAFLSKTIMRATHYSYSHCAMQYSKPDDKWIVHASITGVVPEFADYFFKEYPDTKRFEVKFPLGDFALDMCVSKYRHTPYDFMGIFGAGIVILLSSFGLKINNPFGSKKRFMCTEWIVAWLNECNDCDASLNLKSFYSEVTTPCDLGEYFKTRPDLFEELN